MGRHGRGHRARGRCPARQRVARVGSKPYELIIAAADEHGCDPIFMASHGRSGVNALLLGSETQKGLAHSKMPVRVYRREGGNESGVAGKIRLPCIALRPITTGPQDHDPPF